MPLPLELLREIVFYCVDIPSNIPEEIGVSTKKNWPSIEPLTLASKTYRSIALEGWFRVLFVKSTSDIHELQSLFPGIDEGISELHCVQPNTRRSSIWDLGGLKNLKRIRLDWLSAYMAPHYGSSNSADRLPFTHVPLSITKLDIRGVPWPSPNVFLNIHAIFPNLKVLGLLQQRIWCGLCHTCCVARFSSPGPEKIVYEGGGGLPMHYARVLRDLQHLHAIYITIADFGGGKTLLKQDSNPYFWAGECDSCMEIMYEDETFRDLWVARKKGLTGKDGYIAPPALTRVEWNFWRAEGSEEVDVEESGDEMFEETADAFEEDL